MLKKLIALTTGVLCLLSTAPGAMAEQANGQSPVTQKSQLKKVAPARANNASLDKRERLVKKVVVEHGKRKVIYQRVDT